MRQTQVENMLEDHEKRIKELEEKFKEREEIMNHKVEDIISDKTATGSFSYKVNANTNDTKSKKEVKK